MLMTSVSLLFTISTRGLHQVIEYAYHQITELCYQKTKAITVPIPNCVFLLDLFEGANRFCKMIISRTSLN